MSRKIQPRTSVSVPEEEKRVQNTNEIGKLLFTTYRNRNCALYIQKNRLRIASFFSEKPSRVGAVYIGKIKNLVKNIDACFVEISNGEICFLSLQNITIPYLLNRPYNGRLVEGDELLVQVIRDSHHEKKASVTSRISLANDYFSLTTGEEKVSFSSKLSKEKKQSLEKLMTEKGLLENSLLTQNIHILLTKPLQEGSRLQEKNRSTELKFPPVGCVIRTKAGEAEQESALLYHFHSLALTFFRLLYTARFRSCFSCLQEASPDFETVFQQLPVSSSLEIITDQTLLQERLQEYCREHDIHTNIRLYQDKMLSLSVLYSIESKLETALSSRVWLKSGGYLVIEPTEALTVIDVNSGKYEAGKDSQETYRKINLEAAEEVALQLQLRNLCGIVIVDFISMKSSSYNQELLNYLKDLVEQDRIQTRVIDMTPLGLVEITRKRIHKPLREQFRPTQPSASDRIEEHK